MFQPTRKSLESGIEKACPKYFYTTHCVKVSLTRVKYVRCVKLSNNLEIFVGSKVHE